MTDRTRWAFGPRPERWTALHRRAVARGAHPGMTAEAERLLRPLEHLAMATHRMPAVAALLAGSRCWRPAGGDPGPGDELCSLLAEVVRCSTRALEAHAREGGYVPDCWLADGVAYAELLADHAGDDVWEIAGHLEEASRWIAGAIVATETDVMAVPERLAWALGASLALYAALVDGPG